MSLQMQTFHDQLFSRRAGFDVYRDGLARLARATRAQLASLNLDWSPW
jgi:hypothetical protein